MNDVAWLRRAVGFGSSPSSPSETSPRAELNRMLSAPVPSDPWNEADYSGEPDGPQIRDAALKWVGEMISSDEPFRDWMAYWWHGHFATSVAKVRFPTLMLRQTRLFREMGLGNFRDLVRAVSTDGAMLIYLDGAQSTAAAPNENYSRELMELFTVGVGNFTESDVSAGAAALTGWVVRRRLDGEVAFVSRRHDGSSNKFLDTTVSDVDGVVDAVVNHEACAPFIAGKFARSVLGEDVDDAVIDDISRAFLSSGLEIEPMVRRTLEHGVDGARLPVVQSPFPWFVRMVRATGAQPRPDQLAGTLEGAGQGVWNPPNVAGWPTGEAWFSAASIVARTNIAMLLASSTPDFSPAIAAAEDGPDALANLFDRPEGLSPDVASAVKKLDAGATGLRQRLALAMADPEGVIV